MAMMEPPDENDLFLAIVSGETFDDNVGEVVDVSTLDDIALLNLWNELNDHLRDLREQLQLTNSTDEGRELHSRRSAVRVELAKRNLL
jgi:hypothetical protein